MPIFGKDLDRLQPQITSDVASNAKLRELIMGKNMDLRNTKVQQQQKSDLDVGAKKQEQANALDALVEMEKKGLVNEGGSATVNGVGYGKGYNIAAQTAKSQGQQRQEMTALQKAAKGAIGGPQSDLETADMIHRLMENPSSIDAGTAQIMKAKMALGGNGGKAIASALRVMGMDDATMQGDATGWGNFFSGNSTTKMTPQQINAVKEGAFKLGDDAVSRYENGKTQFSAQAPFVAPGLMNSGGLEKVMPSFSGSGDKLAASHAQRKADYLKGANGVATGLSAQPEYKQPSGITDKLAAWWNGGGQAQPAAASQPAAGGGLSPAEQAELQTLRAKHGR